MSDALMEAAAAVMKNAWSPYSKFRVGAALQAADGTIIAGCNVENASYGGTICAERAAVVAAVAAGHRDFVRLALTSDAPEPITPCGMCRQVLAEFAPDLPITSRGALGNTAAYQLGALLPHAFTGAALKEAR